MQIKVLMVMTTKLDISGISNIVMNYYRFLDKTNIQIDFITPNTIKDRIRMELENGGSKIYKLPMRNKNPLQYIYELHRILISGRYDIIHAHGNSCTLAFEMLAAKWAKTKIRISHCHSTSCKHKILHRMLRPIFNKTYTHGFACGREAGRWLFPGRKFTVIPNGNDLDKFQFNESIRTEYRKQYGLEGKIAIGHVGIFNGPKNHTFLIDIFKELCSIDENYSLILVGDGELKQSIEKKVIGLGLKDKVIFTGQSTEVERLLQAMDIMVFPSKYEGLPNVVIEWQIACLPSLISDTITKDVKATDLVEFFSIDESATSWAKLINRIPKNNRAAMMERARDQIRSAGYDIRKNACKLREIYFGLVSGDGEEYV